MDNITLEKIRPHICGVYGFFGVPFGDYGFLMSKEEIKNAKEEYENRFTKTTSMILGITEEKVKTITKRKKEKGEWCWKHNVSYEIEINKPKLPSFSVWIDEDGRTTISVSGKNGFRIGDFELSQNGEICRPPKSDVNSIDDIAKKLHQFKTDAINKELKKLKEQERKTIKRLETTSGKIKELEEELNRL